LENLKLNLTAAVEQSRYNDNKSINLGDLRQLIHQKNSLKNSLKNSPDLELARDYASTKNLIKKHTQKIRNNNKLSQLRKLEKLRCTDPKVLVES